VGRGRENLRFVDDEKQRLGLGIEGLERVGQKRADKLLVLRR
jgi:hypothetical protein